MEFNVVVSRFCVSLYVSSVQSYLVYMSTVSIVLLKYHGIAIGHEGSMYCRKYMYVFICVIIFIIKKIIIFLIIINFFLIKRFKIINFFQLLVTPIFLGKSLCFLILFSYLVCCLDTGV